MRVCFFFHRFDGGGAERMTIYLANELAARGHQIAIAVRYNTGPLKGMVDQKVKIIDMKLPENGKLVKNIRNVQYLSGLMKSDQWDLMVAVLSEMAQVAAVTRLLSGSRMPLVCVLHNTASVEKTSFSFFRHCLANVFDRQYDQVIAVSKAVEMDYLKHCKRLPSEIVTIYNPVVSRRMEALAAEVPDHPWLAGGRDYKVLVLSGRLSYQKNHELMFKSLKLLRDHGDYRLILLGDGELKESLKALAKKLDIESFVDFVGFVENPYAYMAACDGVVLSSHYEGLPTVLIEALACASRIISVDCPSGPYEILEGGKYGTLVEMDNPRALADGIRASLKKDLNREALRQRARMFSVEKSVDGYEQTFKQVIAHGSKKAKRKNV